MIAVSDSHAEIFEGPLYERSPEVEAMLRPLLPSAHDMEAELRAHLRRSIDGVEVVAVAGAPRVLVVDEETFKRRRLFGRVLLDYECVAAFKHAKAWAARTVDHVRGNALAMARAMADRIVSQAVDLRAERCVDRSVLAIPRLEPILVHMHSPMPRIVGDELGAPLFFVDHCTANVGVIYAAYYFVTPVGVAPKETPCPRP